MVNLWQRLGFFLKGTVRDEQAEQLAKLGKEALQKAQSGLELKYLDGPEADNALKLAAAAAELIKSLQGEQEAILRLGPLLLVKIEVNGKTQIVAETVSTELRRILDNNPRLMNSPTDLFAALQELRDSERKKKSSRSLTGDRPELGT